MKNNVSLLQTKGSTTVEECLVRALHGMDDDHKNMKVISGVIILETDQGVAYFNLQRETILNMIGLLEVAKVFFVDELGNPDNF